MTHLVRTKEENLGLGAAGDVDNLALDTRSLTGNQQVDDRIHKLFKAQLEGSAQVGQDGSLGTTFHDQAVLLLLRA